jgi:ATP-binding cassette subfamily C protein
MSRKSTSGGSTIPENDKAKPRRFSPFENFSMFRAIRLFVTAPGSPVLVLLCLVIAGFAEAMSFGALIPVIALIDSSAAASTPIVEIARRLFTSIGFPMTIGTLTAFIAIGMTAQALLSFGALSIAALARVRLLTVLRQELIRALLSARWSFFSDQRTGTIANTIGTDIISAGNAYSSAARYLASLFQTFALVVVAFLISWQAMAIALGVALLLVFLLRSFLGRSRRFGMKHFRRTADLVALLVDTLNNLKALKTMHRNEPIARLMAKRSQAAQKARLRLELMKAGLQNSQSALTAVIFSGGLYFTATTMDMPLAVLVGLGVFVFRIVYTFSRSQNLLQIVTENEGGYWRSLDFVAQAKAAAEEDAGHHVPTLDHGCVFEKVSFFHDDKCILSDVELTIPKGGITVLQGPSGAGKTTIIDLLTALYRPSSGRILIDGMDLRTISLKHWRSMIGYVPQELTLLHATIAENITLGDDSIDEPQIWRALTIAGAVDFIRDLPLGLQTTVGEMGSKLSGGQRQRIALARAIAARPRLLILDEVTSALDPATERDICKRIGSLQDHFTIVAVTHRPTWSSIATRLYNVAEGAVMEIGDLDREEDALLSPAPAVSAALKAK